MRTSSVSSLLLARGLQRQQEYAIRSALGAQPLRILRGIFTESLLLVSCGGVWIPIRYSGDLEGKISLAHHGVLFLDELPEFKRSVPETMRQPLEEGRFTISRAAGNLCFEGNWLRRRGFKFTDSWVSLARGSTRTRQRITWPCARRFPDDAL